MGKLLTDSTGRLMLEKIDAITGGLSNLNTSNKTSLVNAINEVKSNATSNATKINTNVSNITLLKKYLPQGAVPYGKELTESWASLSGRIRAGDFSNIHIGDYKTITLTTGEVLVMEVAGINQYGARMSCHVDFISRDCLADPHRMNATNNNNGTATEQSPWCASELYQKLNDETTGIYAKLPSDLKPYIIVKSVIAELRYSSGGTVSSDTGWDWKDLGKLWLPTELEVLGYKIYSDAFFSSGSGCNYQYPIFYGGKKHICKGKGTNGNYVTWWTMVARCNSTDRFCAIGAGGDANSPQASNTSIYVPLCFRIGFASE